MTTARDLIKSSLRLIQAIAAGEEPTNAEAQDALGVLNDMLDSWSNEPLLSYFEKDDSHTLDGSSSYTVGSGGDIATTRPLKITGAYVRQSGIDYPLTIAGDRYWERIGDKDTTGQPEVLHYDAQHPLGVISLYPVGDSNYTLYFSSWKQFATYSALTDTVTLPPGYERAIRYNLAVELAPEFGTSAAPEVLDRAERAKRNIKRTNTAPAAMRVDSHLLERQGDGYNIDGDV